jgi:uncharacterized protein (DUF2236 family)
MRPFVKEDSIVRTIWGRGDTILLIFAGASAEFALNKSVDWLYFTGKLPADPLGRLFSTVAYARRIVFAEETEAMKAIDSITSIHKTVEKNRGAVITATAYLDVLFMLIGCSISAYELLERRLRPEEKEEVFAVFHRVGKGMGLEGLPATYPQWETLRARYLQENLEYSKYSKDLYKRYKKSLGWLRYQLLLQAQVLLVPPRIRRLLRLGAIPWLWPAVQVYRFCSFLHLDKGIKTALLPARYRAQVFALDH